MSGSGGLGRLRRDEPALTACEAERLTTRGMAKAATTMTRGCYCASRCGLSRSASRVRGGDYRAALFV
jgi:hypothetical protein